MRASARSMDFVDSRVGRRLVLLFTICALLPLLSLAYLSHRAVRDYLQRSGVRELRDGSKAYAMSLVDRLDVLEAALRDAAMAHPNAGPEDPLSDVLSRRFQQVGWLDPDGSYRPLVGPPEPVIRLTREQRAAALRAGVLVAPGREPVMAVGASPRSEDERLLVARIDAEFLWWGVTRENTMPANTALTVVVAGAPVFSTIVTTSALEEAVVALGGRMDQGLRWRVAGETLVAGYWTAPLGQRFSGGDWIVLWSRPETVLVAPVKRFQWLFALVLSVTLLLVLCLALWQIRRFLVPLEKLRQGTRRIARHDFTTPVEVATDDEFGDLAGSFNEMASQIDALVEDLRRHQLGTLRALAQAIDERSPWTLGHSDRVARLAHRIAERLDLPAQEQWDLHRAALLHDIGKLSVESSLLDRPGALTWQEKSRLQQHVAAGVRILEPVPGYDRIRPIVAQHHERLDGSGYPLGLRTEEIGVGARILAVADSFDALSSNRPYRAGRPLDYVLAELERGAGTLYDPDVVVALKDIVVEGLAGDGRPEPSDGLEVEVLDAEGREWRAGTKRALPS
jgi:putative nucleotidyltransferase with HDIG domain